MNLSTHITWLQNEETREWTAVISEHPLTEPQMNQALDQMKAGQAEPGAVWIVRIGDVQEPPELRSYLEAKARRLRAQR